HLSDIADLLTLRRTSRRFRGIAEDVLVGKLADLIYDAYIRKKGIDQSVEELERDKGPRMAHYRTFLSGLSQHEINELRFMRDPPHEMASRAFRNWLVSLERGVDAVAVENVRPVEKIIMNDSHISYQNVRRVNIAAYRLLIVVAAVIQVVNILDEFKTRRHTSDSISNQISRYKYLIACCADFGDRYGSRRSPREDEEDQDEQLLPEGDGPVMPTDWSLLRQDNGEDEEEEEEEDEESEEDEDGERLMPGAPRLSSAA
ncbi:hypothetical protein HDU93_008371, partial [Gonapodya sp. JEL0774]